MKGMEMWPKAIMVWKYDGSRPTRPKIAEVSSPGPEIWFFYKKNQWFAIKPTVQHIYVFVMRHVDALWKVGGGNWGVRSNGTSHPLPQMSSYHKSRQNLVKFHLSYIFASLCDTSATRLTNTINLDWPWLFPEEKKFRESVKISFDNWQIMLKLRSKHYYQILTWEQTSYCLKPELWSNKSTFPFLL